MELPKLPRGAGSMSFSKGVIRYRKTVSGKMLEVYGKTPQICMEKMKAKEAELEKNRPSFFGTSALLCDAMHEWLVTFKQPELKAKSYDTIESTYNAYIRDSFLGHNFISNVHDIEIQQYLNELNGKYSISTVKKTFSLLNQFFSHFYARSPIDNPMLTVKMPRAKNNVKEEDDIVVLSDEEIRLLTNELSIPYNGKNKGYKHGHMLLFIMWTFTRIGEALALQWKDIDTEKKTVKIYKNYTRVKDRGDDAKNHYHWVIDTPKTKNGTRTVTLCKQAVNCIEEYKKTCANTEPDDYIFATVNGNPISDQQANTLLAKALSRCNINKKVTVHGLRHTGISYFIRHGVSDKVISELAGHSDIGITNKIYYNTIQEQKAHAFDGLDDI